MLRLGFSFGLAWFDLVCLISLFENNDRENTGGENSTIKHLAGKK